MEESSKGSTSLGGWCEITTPDETMRSMELANITRDAFRWDHDDPTINSSSKS